MLYKISELGRHTTTLPRQKMFSNQTMFCPIAYCPIAYFPIAYCLLHKNTETVTFFLVVLNALFAVTNLKQICCAQLYKICII